jgi:Fe2+ transport system protein FeoA
MQLRRRRKGMFNRGMSRRELQLQCCKEKTAQPVALFRLSALVDGEEARIIGIDHTMQQHDSEIRSRLHNMGLASGVFISVISGRRGSNYLLGVGNSRIAIESELAETIMVEKILLK